MSYIEQWYPTNEMLPLNRREGAENNWVLGAWVKGGKLVSMRTVMCDGDGVFWLTPEVKAKSTPQFFRELPEGPMDKTEVDRLRTDLAAARAEAERAALWAAHLKLHLGELQRKVADFVRGASPAEWRHKEPRIVGFGLEFEEMKRFAALKDPEPPPADATSESRCAALAKECESLKEQLRVARVSSPGEIPGGVVTSPTATHQLEADSARLDWLQDVWDACEAADDVGPWERVYCASKAGASLRAAIDAARADAARKEP